MPITSAAHLPRAAVFTLLAILALLVGSARAEADPGTVTGSLLSMTVSDTTPAPGQTITVSLSYNRPAADDGGTRTFMGFGRNFPAGINGVNLGELALVPGSCTGQFSNCSYNAGNAIAFRADVPVGSTGDTITGSAQFTVSSGAADGDVISFAGLHFTSDHFNAATGTISLAVTAPPAADLGVGLTASAPLLGAHVDYDAAVTNNGPGAASSATITTQLGSQASSIAAGSTCTFSSTTHQVSCPIGALANGATTHATFTINYSLLSLGALNATATRTASSPTDPNAANDSASANCNAITSLLISC